MKRFPLKPSALWRLTYPSVTFGVLLFQGHKWWMTGQFRWPNATMVMSVAAIYALCLYLLLVTKAGPEGLRLPSKWGLQTPVTWEAITSVRMDRHIGLYHGFRLECGDGKVFWLSRDIANLAELHAIVAHNGGPQHPLAVALSTPLHQL